MTIYDEFKKRKERRARLWNASFWFDYVNVTTHPFRIPSKPFHKVEIMNLSWDQLIILCLDFSVKTIIFN